MARSNIPMVINLRQNKNDDSTAYGKWFAEVDSKEPLNLKGLAKHMMEHGKISSEEMCNLVLGEMVKCMVHLIREGQPVKLDGFGTFSPSVDGQKLGKNSLAKAVEAGPDAMINGIKINFTPENTKGEQLTSRAFKEDCVFENNSGGSNGGSQNGGTSGGNNGGNSGGGDNGGDEMDQN